MKKFNIFPYIFVFLATFLILQLFQGDKVDPVLDGGPIGLKTIETDYAVGKEIKVIVQNNQDEAFTLEYNCMDLGGETKYLLPPFVISRYEDEQFKAISSSHLPECEEDTQIVIEPSGKETISLLPYSYSYFGEVGRYRIDIETPAPTPENPDGVIKYSSPEFEIEEPGLFTQGWRTFIYNPILNLLVGMLIYLPGHNLAIAIILLTVFIRTLLLAPSHKAMKAQKRMQDMQPRLEELKKKYANDQTRLAQETMLLWKTHKVNPLSSCLPILIQLPILIALFYVVNGGLSPDRSVLVYDFLPHFSLHEIDTMVLGFDLLTRSIIVLPLIVGGLQFLQMQLMQARKKKKTDDKPAKSMQSEMEAANKMMKYIMPVMIAVFTAQLPAAVGLYWGTSTFYGILQQLVVNREGSKPQSPDDEVQVKVINRNHGKAN